MLNSKSTKTTGKSLNEQPTRGILSASEKTPAITGRTLGAFEVGELLGEGGMGAVFHGRDKALDRPVAIKVLHTKLAADDEFVERFVREARTAAKLNHANVVQIYGAGYDEGIAYMALELVTGCSLFDLYKAQRPFPARRACELIRDVALGLAVAHEQGVIHRDIKPENILISDKGVPKLADFGLARASDQRITETGVFLGTPQYASPEQCNADELTPASDLYSLGVVLYELLAGRPPYEAPTPLTLFKKILMEAPEPLAGYCPDLPPSLIALINRLLEKEPASRYTDAAVLAADLDRASAGLPEVSFDMDPYNLVSIVRADSLTVQTPASDSSRTLPFQETRGTLPLAPAPEPDAVSSLKLAQVFLAGVAAILICAVIGLGLARLRTPANTAKVPTPPVVQAPLRVAVIPWSNQAKAKDFDWLGRALPDFLVSQLSKRPDAILVEAPANVGDAGKGLDLSDASDRRKLAQLLGVDLVIGGSFYVDDGGHVVLNAQVETETGVAKQIPGTPAIFAKSEVLGALNQFAEALANAIAGPSADTLVVASAAEAQGGQQSAMVVDRAPAAVAPPKRARPRASVELARLEKKGTKEEGAQEKLAKLESELVEKEAEEAAFALRALPETKNLKGKASTDPQTSSPMDALSPAEAGASPSTGFGGPGSDEATAGRGVGGGDEKLGERDDEQKLAARKLAARRQRGSVKRAKAAPEKGTLDGANTDADDGDGTPAADKALDGKKNLGVLEEDEKKDWGSRSGTNTPDQSAAKAGESRDEVVAGKPATPPVRSSSVAPVGSKAPAFKAKGLAPELARLKECLEQGEQWETFKALDVCAQSDDLTVIKGALKAIDHQQDTVSKVYKTRLEAKLAR